MNENSEVQIAPEIYEEILRNTDRKNYIPQTERLLRKSMVQLVKSGHAAFLFIKDDECREYWASLVNAASKEVEKKREAWRLYDIKISAWNRLSESDRKIIKIRKPTMPKFERI